MGLKSPNSAVATVTTVTGVTSGGIPEIAGAAGIPTWPAGAAAANAVSLAEAIRYQEDIMVGAAGVVTWPTAAAYANGVNVAEVLAYIQDSVRAASGAYIPGYGHKVTKTHNLTTDNTDLFTVTGKVLMTLLTGEITTIVATTTTYAMRIKTSAEVIFPATTITTDADNTMYLFGGDNTVVLNNAGTPITRVGFLDSAGPLTPMVIGLAGGSDIIESDTSGAGTGVVVWSMWYLPLEAGASVVAV